MTGQSGNWGRSVPNTDKIYYDWGAERLLVTSCELTSELVRPLVKPICKRDLFFVILWQEPDLDMAFQLLPLWGFEEVLP